MLIRGVFVFIALILLLRVVLKRQTGQIALADVLVIALVAGIGRNSLVADAYSITDGLGVVLVILACSYAADWLSFYVPWVHRLLHPSPVKLVSKGKVHHQHLEKELMTEHQLRCKLRGHGVKELEEVDEAWLEGNGEISVVPRK
jgi:uncharacterized membrane protein YcaP (DUF421 family)